MNSSLVLVDQENALSRPEPTIRDIVPRFLQWFQFVRNRGEETVRAYRFDLEMFLGFCDRARLTFPKEVSFREIEVYLGWLQHRRGSSPRTANRHLSCLRTFWRYLIREGSTEQNPAAQCFNLKEQKKLPNYLSIEEQERILRVLSTDQSLIGKRDLALIATGLFAGLRCEELCALRVDNVNLESSTLRVVNGKGGKDREIHVIPRLAAILREYLQAARPALVHRPSGAIRRVKEGKFTLYEYSKGYIGTFPTREEAEKHLAPPSPDVLKTPWFFVNASATLSHRQERAGRPLERRAIFHRVKDRISPIVGRIVSPHTLRHSFASRLRENGADLQLIQDALGHANITTTTIYARISTRKRKMELEKYLGGEETLATQERN